MDNFSKVTSIFADLPYMKEQQAAMLRDLITDHDAVDLLEIGFYHGKSSAYIAATLEDLGRGHLTTVDLESAVKRKPNISQVLSRLGLEHRVTPVFAHRSYTWELSKLIQAESQPRFDLCYFDGGHTWDQTGFGFLLVDMLLRPGGLIVFDDLQWTINASIRDHDSVPKYWSNCGPDERATPAVQLVFDLLVPHLGYTEMKIVNDRRWGIARKPIDSKLLRVERRSLAARITAALAGR